MMNGESEEGCRLESEGEEKGKPGKGEEGICSVTMPIEGLTLPYGTATLIGWAEIGRSWIPDLALLARNDGKRHTNTSCPR